MAHIPAVNIFIPRNEIPIPRREEEVDRYRGTSNDLDGFMKLLFMFFGLMIAAYAAIGKKVTEHESTVVALLLLLVLYYLLWLTGTMLGSRIQWLPKILRWITLVLGSVIIVLGLTVINSVIAWLALGFLSVVIFPVTAYYYYDELYQLLVRPVSDTINRLITSRRGQSADLPV